MCVAHAVHEAGCAALPCWLLRRAVQGCGFASGWIGNWPHLRATLIRWPPNSPTLLQVFKVVSCTEVRPGWRAVCCLPGLMQGLVACLPHPPTKAPPHPLGPAPSPPDGLLPALWQRQPARPVGGPVAPGGRRAGRHMCRLPVGGGAGGGCAQGSGLSPAHLRLPICDAHLPPLPVQEKEMFRAAWIKGEDEWRPYRERHAAWGRSRGGLAPQLCPTAQMGLCAWPMMHGLARP